MVERHAEPRPTAIVSDIHGNLEAFQTVLDDIDARGIERIVCLGDILGYGPNPRECLDLVMDRCEWSLMGNHDFASLYEPTRFNNPAQAAAFWTRRQLELEPDLKKHRRRWEYIGGLEIRRQENSTTWVHASPRRPINEYIFSDDVYVAPAKMRSIFEMIDHACFVGHTHVPGIFTDEPDLDFMTPDDMRGVFTIFDDDKFICNPGSVGQPRDRDPRAAYAIHFEERNQIEFVRLTYDIDTVLDKIRRTPALVDYLGERLRNGS